MVLLAKLLLGITCTVVSVSFVGGRATSNFVFGECSPGKDSCRDCYISLAQNLFQSDDNVFNLSKAFFPPDTNTPEFVVVRYHFQNTSTDTVKTWFWAASASYFIYPLATFQFLSLFFGKPEAYWTAEVDVVLNATECEGVRMQHLTMLTQRLRIYVEQYDIRPSIDDTYQAEAMNVMAFDDLFNKNSHQLTTIVICVQTVGVIMILTSAIVIIACTSKFKGQPVNKIKYKPTIGKQAMLISISLNGTMFLLYTIAMDGAAIHYRDHSLLSDLTKVHHKDRGGQPFDILYNLPIVVLLFDIVAVLICISTLLFAVGYFCYKAHTSTSHSLSTLIPSILGTLLSIITHSPFIAIAYINDSYYASSIFVYYMVIFFVCFAAVHTIVNACLQSAVLDESKFNFWNCIFKKGDKKPQSCKPIRFLCPITVIFLVLILILLTVALVIIYFVIIPLNGSVSGAPHQLIGFYQSIIIFLGILITYKTILHKKYGGLKGAIKSRKESPLNDGVNWKDLPDEEKTARFYDMYIDLVKEYHKEKAPPAPKASTESDSEDMKQDEEQPLTAVTPV